MAGYRLTPLVKKLGIKDGHHMRAFNTPAGYQQWLGTLPDVKWVQEGPYDVVHLFTNRLPELEEYLYDLRDAIHPAGMIWVSWNKKSSGLQSGITEDLIRDTALPLGLVDVKVCAVTEVWSGLKLVIRRSAR